MLLLFCGTNAQQQPRLKFAFVAQSSPAQAAAAAKVAAAAGPPSRPAAAPSAGEGAAGEAGGEEEGEEEEDYGVGFEYRPSVAWQAFVQAALVRLLGACGE